ncbi:DUF551 domain-containing protein [Elizabethkingia meningoseptica]|uniref:DUF551 domain-containing protein n=1 Tax=Elizabethkingia meningoseptica TaxID=238 RepID=UPI0013661D42|nr:DUF551 domain-containing protein [Elizabethkingia meningoseptica]MCT4156967.1 hypothetical protein [Elizabethkingia anophelis]MCT4171299.1 hypothetical protein [Elizabethkingia anophelis]MCT4245714.1 hypothetical protein [Elizabethkingia anophelis]MCT4249408.1 hypothetical protein [Elizabethkingia anophelis]MCT4260438.1 hypothetical protein [Elizabethkingia anophelis]
MNSQNSKNNAIKAAYGEYYKDYRRFIDENGFIYQSDLFFPETGMKKDGVEAEIISVEKKHKWSNIKWRPMSLQGLENNRGWTRIESEEDLPDKYGQYWVFTSNGNIIDVYYDEYNKTWDGILDFFEVKATHWQQIVKPKPPIF